MVHPASFQDHIKLADQAAAARNWPSAAEYYSGALSIEVNSPLLVQYGHMLKEAGFLDAAANAYRAATAWDGTDADAHLHLGHLLKRLNRMDEALAAFRSLAKIPNAPYVKTEIDGLLVAQLNTARTRTMPSTAGEVQPPMPEALRQADLRLHEKLTRDIAARQSAVPARQERQGRKRPVLPMSVAIPVSMEPVAHVIAEDGAYRATTGNPRMRIQIIRPFALSDIEESWIDLSLRIDGRDAIVDPVLLIEHKAGWADFTALRLTRRSSHVYGALARLHGPILELRLDPMHSAGAFSFSQLSVSRLSAMAVWLRAFQRDGAGFASASLQAWLSDRRGWESRLEQHVRLPADDLYGRWIEHFEKPRNIPSAEQTVSKREIGFVLPLAGEDLDAFRSTLDSLKTQTQINWQLAIVIDEKAAAPLREAVGKEAGKDQRVKAVPAGAHLAFGDRLEFGRKALQAEFIGHLEPGDRLSADMVETFSRHLGDHADLRILYCDDDRLGKDLKRHSPRFKPEWNADYGNAHDYVGRSVVFSAAALDAAGGYRGRFAGNEDFDLLLRAASACKPGEIGHLARPLWHLGQENTKEDITGPVGEILAASGSGIVVKPGLAPRTVRLVWPMPSTPPHVTIIIPTRDRLDLVKRAIDTILDRTDYPSFDIIVVDNGSVEDETLQYFAQVSQSGRVTILRDEGPFNFSRLNNRAADIARGSVLALVNNDVEIVDRGWLSEMVPMAVDPGIGAVGAKLLYASGHVQHAGIVGGVGTVAAHGHKYSHGDDAGYMNRLVVQQEVIAVTAACLVVEAGKYRAVGGLDAENLTVAFNDVDLCLKLAERGWRAMFTPFARLLHHESLSRGLDISGARAARFREEADHMIAQWGNTLLEDRFYSPSLTRAFEDFSLSIVDVSA